MTSDTDVPHQPNTLQQKPRTLKPLIWKVIFVLLLTVNVIFVSWAGYLIGHRSHTADLSGLVVISLSLPLAIIDFIALFFYIKTLHPQRIAKVISYTAFIAVTFVLTFDTSVVVFFFGHVGYYLYDLFFFIPNPVLTLSAVIATVSTLIIVVLFRSKSHK
jgi:hypothetical protein